MTFNIGNKRRWQDDDSWYLIGEISNAIKAAKKNPLHDVILPLPSANFLFKVISFNSFIC